MSKREPDNSRVSMSNLAQLSAGREVDATIELALKFIPIVELHADFSNFDEWEHSIRFYLDYHGLYGYIDPKFEIQCTSGPIHRHRLFVYSLIWGSAKAALRRMGKDLSNELYGNHRHDPKLLLEVFYDYRTLYADLPTGSGVEVLEVCEDWR